MKKAFGLTAVAAALALALSGCGDGNGGNTNNAQPAATQNAATTAPADTTANQPAATTDPANQTNQNNQGGRGGATQYDESQFIGEDEAKRIALEEAGVAEADTRAMYVRLGYDDGRPEYEVDFVVGDFEYDYDIDAMDGTIWDAGRDSVYDD
ncbi:MAG: hypothetical protein LBM23_10310 [Propionibacteriaceae bacterium]|jgi:uncharacterized membrane protein YkoI|nr:hypothetical protein [Propionibacteriaceae bacterium]